MSNGAPTGTGCDDTASKGAEAASYPGAVSPAVSSSPSSLPSPSGDLSPQSWYSRSYSGPPIVGISGIIGAGKTSLATRLSKRLHVPVVAEPVTTNPYLSLFYSDKKAYSFPMQVFLLSARFQLHQRMVWGGDGAIQDRTIYEDPIFALMLRKSGDMSELDFGTYSDLFRSMTHFLHRPDVIIYLDVSAETAMERIVRRGRECERGIPIEYLRSLREGYEDWLRCGLTGIRVMRVAWADASDEDGSMDKAVDSLVEGLRNMIPTLP
jgi:deoxyadenosine kinase